MQGQQKTNLKKKEKKKNKKKRPSSIFTRR